MRFTQATVAATSIFAIGSLAVTLPQNAGNGGNSITNSCDARGTPEITYGKQKDGPNPVNCGHLSKLVRSGSVFGDRTTIGPKGRTFTSGGCQFFASCPVFDDGTPYYLGKDDCADLIDSAIQDFKDAEDGKICVKISNSAKFVAKENNIVSCGAADGSERLINVKYEIRKSKSGGTLN